MFANLMRFTQITSRSGDEPNMLVNLTILTKLTKFRLYIYFLRSESVLSEWNGKQCIFP